VFFSITVVSFELLLFRSYYKTTFACNQALILQNMSRMETNMDFIQWLGPDLSIKVFSCLDDPGDLVRASAVCSSWEHFGMIFEFYYLKCYDFIM
jgi:hypothetical protein